MTEPHLDTCTLAALWYEARGRVFRDIAVKEGMPVIFATRVRTHAAQHGKNDTNHTGTPPPLSMMLGPVNILHHTLEHPVRT